VVADGNWGRAFSVAAACAVAGGLLVIATSRYRTEGK
jgi:hypothetical protein